MYWISTEFIQSMDLEIKKRKRGDELTDHVRILYWYRFIGKSLGTLEPNVLHSLVEHGGVRKRYGESPNSRYLFYSRGAQLPRDLVTRMAEQRVPGSAAILNHVLWRLLHEDALISKRRAKTWLAEITRDIRELAEFDSFGYLSLWVEERVYLKIERRASLDALALLTLHIRVGIEENERPYCLEAWAACLQRVLLILGPELDELGLSHKIFDLFSSRIGAQILQPRQLRLLSTSTDYIRAHRLLHAQAKRYAESAKPQERINTAVRILRGNIVTALTYTHSPFFEPDPHFVGPLPKEIANITKDQIGDLVVTLLYEGLLRTDSGRSRINYLWRRERWT